MSERVRRAENIALTLCAVTVIAALVTGLLIS